MRLGLFFKEGRRRKLSPLWSRIVGVLVVLFAAVELYGAPFGFIDSFILRSLFVSFAITLTFICYTPIRTEPGLINGMKTSGKKRDNLGSIGKSFRRGCNSIAESATKKEGNQPSFFVGG